MDAREQDFERISLDELTKRLEATFAGDAEEGDWSRVAAFIFDVDTLARSQAEQAAREKALEEAAQWHEGEASRLQNYGHAVGRVQDVNAAAPYLGATRTHQESAKHLRALKEKS